MLAGSSLHLCGVNFHSFLVFCPRSIWGEKTYYWGNSQLLKENDKTNNVLQKIPCLPDSIQNRDIFIIAENYTYHLSSLVSFLLMGILECAVFILCLIWNVFQQVRCKKISRRTFELQIKFFIALIIQMGVPAFMLVIPLTYVWVSILYNYYDQVYSNSVIIIETFHGLFSTLVMIFIHYPYRQAFISIFFKCLIKPKQDRLRSAISVAPISVTATRSSWRSDKIWF